MSFSIIQGHRKIQKIKFSTQILTILPGKHKALRSMVFLQIFLEFYGEEMASTYLYNFVGLALRRSSMVFLFMVQI